MKNLVFILSVAISLFILSGCDDSESIIVVPPETPDDDIVGYWKMTKIVKDGVDLTDDCTTRTYQSIRETNKFSGHDYDYDAERNDCLLTLFNGEWLPLTSNLYTFTIYGNDYISELNGDTLTSAFFHPFDGQYYELEYNR